MGPHYIMHGYRIQKWRSGVLSEVNKLLSCLHTAPDLRNTTMQGLHQLFNQEGNRSKANFKLYKAQQNHLFMSLFDGNVHNMWLEHQDKYLWDKKLRTHLSTGDQ
eukprot:5101209-Ditylum_brightwellii.AAC.1